MTTAPYLDIAKVRADFPALQNGMCYLDTGASAQKPQCVIDTVHQYTAETYANVHRGFYAVGTQTTQAYESARDTVTGFINAPNRINVIFTNNTTSGINLVANSFRAFLSSGDRIITTVMEHHSNLVPWQMMRDNYGIDLQYCPLLADGSLDMEAFHSLLTPNTKLVAVTHVSNVLGTTNPIKTIIKASHAVGAKVLIDGSQAILHTPINVIDLDCDFYVFTGHKIYAPSGIGVLYGKTDILQAMPPFMGGGDMIKSVTLDKTEYADLPNKFEAGTPPITQAIALGTALNYVTGLGLDAIAHHEQQVNTYLHQQLNTIDGLKILGTTPEKAPVASFAIDGVHAMDLATLLGESNVCVRAGHHCAEPLMHHYGVTGTVRASLGVYNTYDDVDILITTLNKALKLLK